MMHQAQSPLAGTTVLITKGVLAGQRLRVEDWWDRIAGRSWMLCDGNPACLEYAVRERTPLDDEVVYGKIGSRGFLVHITLLEEPA